LTDPSSVLAISRTTTVNVAKMQKTPISSLHVEDLNSCMSWLAIQQRRSNRVRDPPRSRSVRLSNVDPGWCITAANPMPALGQLGALRALAVARRESGPTGAKAGAAGALARAQAECVDETGPARSIASSSSRRASCRRWRRRWRTPPGEPIVQTAPTSRRRCARKVRRPRPDRCHAGTAPTGR
jgi:hypothetical protein